MHVSVIRSSTNSPSLVANLGRFCGSSSRTSTVNAGYDVTAEVFAQGGRTGKVPSNDLLNSLKSGLGLVSIAGGFLATWLSGRGFVLLAEKPGMLPGIVLGTLIAVTFKGVAVGPLVAAGIASVALALFGK